MNAPATFTSRHFTTIQFGTFRTWPLWQLVILEPDISYIKISDLDLFEPRLHFGMYDSHPDVSHHGVSCPDISHLDVTHPDLS